MNSKFEMNITRSEAIRRHVIGTALIGSVLVSPMVPVWIALFACYPIFTAMIQWDPVNALMQKAVNSLSKDVQEVVFRNGASSS